MDFSLRAYINTSFVITPLIGLAGGSWVISSALNDPAPSASEKLDALPLSEKISNITNDHAYLVCSADVTKSVNAINGYPVLPSAGSDRDRLIAGLETGSCHMRPGSRPRPQLACEPFC
jgi:hypothetical protein